MTLTAAWLFAGLPALADTEPAEPADSTVDREAEPAEPHVDREAEPAEPHVDREAEQREALAQQRYDEAFEAMIEGDYETALAGFEHAASHSADSDTRAAARELARLARSLGEADPAAAPPPALKDPGDPPAAVEPTPIAEDDRPDAGRIQFVASTTSASLYGGIVLAVLAETGGDSSILLATGVTGAGFGLSLAASSRLRLTQGVADAYGLGLSLGAIDGLLVGLAVDASARETLVMSVGGMVAGGFAGYQLGQLGDPTSGQVRLTTNLSGLGAATAGLGLATVQPDISARSVSLIILGGMNAGAVSGILAGRNLDWSRSRADLVLLSTSLGGLAGIAISAATLGGLDDGQERIAAGTVLAGLWGGFGLGALFTRNMEPSERYTLERQRVSLAPISFEDGGAGLSLVGSF